MSIGVVLHESSLKVKKAGRSMEEMYMSFFDHLPLASELKKDAVIAPNKTGKGSPVYMASDYSYMSQDIGKKNYRLVGDSAGEGINANPSSG